MNIADAGGTRLVRAAKIALGAAYLASIFLDNVGSRLPEHVLPRPLLYFTQVAALFPKEATASIDYRAQAWVCGKGWQEIDVRPYFPIDPDDKENRFQRTMYFYYALEPNRPTMQALERYVVDSHNEAWRSDGIGRDVKIAGARFLSLRVPIPAPGAKPARFVRVPLADVPESERHYMYWTPRSERRERCGAEVEE